MGSDIAVGFDFDHTLGIDNKLERTTALEMVAALAAREGIAYDAAAADAAVDEMLASYRGGSKSVEAAVAGFFETFAPAGAKVADAATDFRERVVERAPDFIEALPGALELLAELDSLGIAYALLTNGWSPLQEEKARLIQFRGSVYVSERIGALKPSREAFEVLRKHFDLPFERIWYVGDDPVADCAGAAGHGLRTVWFDWEGRSYPDSLARPEYVIHNLAELPALLQGRVREAANESG
jgi:FMN phosphatase YigB (HAD superfamily)